MPWTAEQVAAADANWQRVAEGVAAARRSEREGVEAEVRAELFREVECGGVPVPPPAGVEAAYGPPEVSGMKVAPAFFVGQECVTRDGRKARVVCVDRDDSLPVVALYAGASGGEGVSFHTADGLSSWGHGVDHKNDLLPAPRRAVVWVAVWGPVDEVGGLAFSRERPKDAAKATCCIRVELEEGRFDE